MPKVNINISATDDASAVIRKVTEALKEQEKGSGNLTGAFVKGNLIMKGVEAGFEAVKSATVDLTAASLKSFGTMEQNQIALKTMLGSSQEMYQVIGEITKAAAETPFEMQDLVTGAKNLIAFGEGADTVVGTMKMLGDVAAGVSIPINDLITKYGQIRTQGRAMTMDLREFAGRGIPIYEALAKTMKINESQVVSFASAGKIGFKEIEEAFQSMTAEGAKFGGLMEAQSQSLNGMISNLSDTYDILLTQIGSRMEDEAKRGVAAVSQSLKEGGILNAILVDLGKAGETSLDVLSSIMETTDERFRTLNGTAKNFKKGIEDLGLEKAAIRAQALSHPIAALNYLFTQQGEKIEAVKKQYELYLSMGIKTREDLEAHNKHYDDLETARMKQFEKGKKKEDEKSTAEIDNWKKKRDEALKYYNDLVYNTKMAHASDEERIEITLQKELESLDKKKAYLKAAQYEEAKGLLNSNAEEERNKLRVKKTADMYADIAAVQTQFFTSTASEEANAIGQMSQQITSAMQKMSGDVSKVLADVAADSRKNGLSMGDGFKIGASVAVAALSSINAVLSMQSALVQASYQRQIDALREKQEAELEALEESYTALEEDSENKEELRLLQLAAYRESLQGQIDADIEYALAKKEAELKAANASTATEKKKEEEQKKIEQKYAMEEWKLEVEAFKSKQESDKTAVMMATAIGVTNAWASAMHLPFPVNVAVGGTLSALMLGTAAKQISLISSQKPPAPPQFAGGVSNFEGGWAVVGEKGPELVTLGSGSNVVTNENVEKLLSGSGPQYILNNIYINGVLTQQDLVDLRKASAYGGY